VDDACTIDHDLQAPKVRDGLFNRVTDLILLGDVALEENSLAAPARDLLDSTVTPLNLDINYGYLCPLSSKEFGGGFAHTGRTTADPGNLAI
jgi:hypothetical protein